ncbi:unnamed protein product [Owenia fusiformis]|uniref:Uncharacterized protein n=1 Tax=Owenia fusiformis TaxID=6347 RepID=A0A8J1U0F5_OWEFU|nr:unnamed protein product [Owenia fusiformis]
MTTSVIDNITMATNETIINSTTAIPGDMTEDTNRITHNVHEMNIEMLKPILSPEELSVHMVIEIILMVLICTGNIPVLMSMYIYKCLHSVTNMFLVSLAIADLMMGLFGCPLDILILYVMPLTYGHHIQDKWLCAARLFSHDLSVGASVFSMVGIAIDRFIAVKYPLRYCDLVTHKRAGIYICIIWVYCIIVSSGNFVGDIIKFGPGDICRSNMVMDPKFALFLKCNLGASFLVSTIAHIVVAMFATHQRARVASELAAFNNNLAVAYKKQNRITKTMSLIVGMFILCWLPWVLLSLVKFKRPEPKWYKHLFYFTVEISIANSLINPWIYAFQLKLWKKAMRNVLFCRYQAQISDD